MLSTTEIHSNSLPPISRLRRGGGWPAAVITVLVAALSSGCTSDSKQWEARALKAEQAAEENYEASAEWKERATEAERELKRLEDRQRDVATEKAQSEDERGEAVLSVAYLSGYADELRAAVDAYDGAVSVLASCRDGMEGVIEALSSEDGFLEPVEGARVVTACEQADADLADARDLVPPPLAAP